MVDKVQDKKIDIEIAIGQAVIPQDLKDMLLSVVDELYTDIRGLEERISVGYK